MASVCTECPHVFTDAELAAEDPKAWGHPCHGVKDEPGTVCESYRAQYSGVIGDVLTRRDQQDARWGGPEHDDEHDEFDWQEFIRKQVNQAADADNSNIWRDRMLDIAALAVAALQWADRKDAAQAEPSPQEIFDRTFNAPFDQRNQKLKQ